ncbi:hypothetical protein JOC34_002237 [Virgibacillus halotolerans]|uniref:DUF1811 family protein n=1 Tax=Virgibacillus halotolerans TaxID=1071053 RepID=UPI001961F734|nr:DUF1811 family protein [Virgibacillus halotolerans]MBM7599869.1 hypothetical protein [Virgibacillus halotolerans]
MTHRYKIYSHEQLQAEEEILQKKLREAEQLGRRSHVAVNKRKIEIVRSYRLNPADFKPGDVRELKEEPGHFFKIDEVNGVVAWGYRMAIDTRREGILIALLGDLADGHKDD